MKQLRSPTCVVVGHVDHGKSSILDRIRGTAIVNAEPGRITQAIGASIIPLDTLKKICGKLYTQKTDSIPGLLFVDTPGHAAFISLRRRGGSIADLAVVVIDINEGFKPQTIEAIEILRTYKTPFVIAANKVDLVDGWQSLPLLLSESLGQQRPQTMNRFETKLYEIVGQLFERFQMNGERYDRIEDFTKQIAVIPCSAKTGEGIPELLLVLSGLAQKFLSPTLGCDITSPGRGTILEVKEEIGFGTTIDVILYDGFLKVNDTIVVGALGQPIVTKVRALLEPKPNQEMRDKKSKFNQVKSVCAATGVKIVAPGLEAVVAGMPVQVGTLDLENVKLSVQKEVEGSLIECERHGISIKGDTLGSLEALQFLLKEKGIAVRRASIGKITKKDISDAVSVKAENPLDAVIVGFNVGGEGSSDVKIITSDVIYTILDQLVAWREGEKKRMEAEKIDTLVRPAKMKILKGYVFRQSNPAVVGVEILGGIVKVGMPIMKDGRTIAVVKSIQHEKESLSKVASGKQVAVSIDGVTVGRQIHEEDLLYSSIPEKDFRKFKEFKEYLSAQELDILKEIAQIMRKETPLWGV